LAKEDKGQVKTEIEIGGEGKIVERHSFGYVKFVVGVDAKGNEKGERKKDFGDEKKIFFELRKKVGVGGHEVIFEFCF
jgi:hypothetical protein